MRKLLTVLLVLVSLCMVTTVAYADGKPELDMGMTTIKVKK